MQISSEVVGLVGGSRNGDDPAANNIIMPVTRQGTNNAMTLESIQAMIDREIQRNSTQTQDNASQSSGGGLRRPVQPAGVCSYIDFIKCQPLNFKGIKGIVGLSQCLKKMELVFHISGCVIDNQVKFATCTLLGAALTWWNGHVRTLGHEAVMAYTHRFRELALMCTKFLADETEKVDKYVNGLPNNIHGNVMSARPKTLDETIELANDLMDQKLRTYAERQNDNKRKTGDSSRNSHQQVSGNDVAAYTHRFRELALMCTKFLADETEKVDKYVNGLPNNIHGNVMSARPKTLDETIELANDLMDQKLRTYAERQNDNKRKTGDSSRNSHQQ
nr:hypothetical protein [Tanacetum cinerariifolium]